jgi:hypothetical protein
MACTITQAKKRILNKWNWDNASLSYPVILWGPPGIGKTELVVSLVCERMIKELELKFYEDTKDIQNKESEEYIKIKKEFDRKYKILNFNDVTHELLELITPHCLVLRLAERPIEQLQGVVVPSLSEEKNFARFVMPENLVKLKDSPWGIVFLDELDKASESKFGAATHILENRVIGDMQLGDGWYVIAAANREEDSHLSNPIPPELRNRCANIEVESDLNVWLEWASTHGVRRDIMSFHKFKNGEWLAKYDLDQTYSFCTPRSWTHASRVIDSLEKRLKINKNDHKQMEEFQEIIKYELIDFVGKQGQMEYFTYRDLYLKFNFMEILEGKKRIPIFNPSDNNQSLISDQCVAAFAMADQVLPEHLGKKEGDKFVINTLTMGNLVQFITDLTPEIRTLYLQMIHRTRIMHLLLDSGQADSIVDEIVQYLAAA